MEATSLQTFPKPFSVDDLIYTGRDFGRQTEARIAYFSESILPWVDGVSRSLGKLFDTLEERGRDFRIYSPIQPSPEYSWSRQVRPLRSLPFPLYRDYRVSLPEARGLAADLDRFAPNLIHVCSPTPAGVWAQAYARSRGIRVVGTFHTNFVSYFRYYRCSLLSGLGWRGLRWFYNRCDTAFAPSQSMARELAGHGIDNVGIWSRGIDCDWFSPLRRDPELRRRLAVDDETPLLLLVSRLVREKDLTDLIEMDWALKQRGVSYRLAFVGNGPLRQELEQGLPDASFVGQKTGLDLARWYASADVFVFPSTTEAFGNVVQEAMASGLPAVVVDKGGPPGVIEPGRSGLVARANRPQDLADKVETLLRDPALRRHMGEQGRRLALTRSWEQINAALLADYDAIAARSTVREAAFA